MDLSRLFRPRSVAIIGASDRNPWSAMVARSLDDIGFQGELQLINRRGTPALGRETITSCSDARPIDAAFLAVPAAALEDAIDDMAAGGIRYGAVVTSGFAEVGQEGASAQQRVFDRARDQGVTLLGPNSLGFANFVDSVSLSAIPMKLPVLRNPRVALVSQSGATAAMIYAFAHQQNVGITYSIAMGNEALVDLADVLKFLVHDRATKAIAVFAEAVRDPLRFEAAARAAAAARKPIVILKVGSGELTATVAQAHTGALVGDDKVFQAVCDAYNIVRVASLEDLVITADLLAATGPVDPDRGFALVSVSGGACELVSDRGDEQGIAFPQFSRRTLDALSGVIADYGAAHNPLDITGAAMREHQMFSRSIRAIGGDDQVGLIGVITELPSSSQSASPMSEGQLRETALGAASVHQPVICIQQYLKPVSDHARSLIEHHDLPVVVGGIDHAMRAVGALYRWSGRLAIPVPVAPTAAVGCGERPSGELATLAYLASQSVPVIPQEVARTRAEAMAAAVAMEGPVVLKILSPDIAHKTEVGGVKLDLAPGPEVGAAYNSILANVAAAKPDARIEGVLVSPMRVGGIELIVGIARDPVWGLALAVGMGGIWVELLNDTQLHRLPVTPDAVERMLRRLRSSKLLEGYRGSKPVDLAALAQVIARIGDAALALGDELSALEINPLRVDGGTIEALDALALWSAP